MDFTIVGPPGALSALDLRAPDGTARLHSPPAGETAAGRKKRGPLNMKKCEQCRKHKKKCEPQGSAPNERCRRCEQLDYECSEPTRKRRKATPVAASPVPAAFPLAAAQIVTGTVWTDQQLLAAIGAYELYRASNVRIQSIINELEDHLKFHPPTYEIIEFVDYVFLKQEIRSAINHRLLHLQSSTSARERAFLTGLKHRLWADSPLGDDYAMPLTGIMELVDEYTALQDYSMALSILSRTMARPRGDWDLDPAECWEKMREVHSGIKAQMQNLPNTTVKIPKWIREATIMVDLASIHSSRWKRYYFPQLQSWRGRDYTGSTLLHALVASLDENGKDEWKGWFGEYLDSGVDIDAPDFFGRTPLHIAGQRGLPTVAKLLLDHGSDIESLTNGKHTPLHYATAYRRQPVFDILKARGADINAKDDLDGTVMYYAARGGDEEMWGSLLDNTKLQWFHDIHYAVNPVFAAIESNNWRLLRRIAAHPSFEDDDLRWKTGTTALYEVARVSGLKVEIIDFLIQRIGHLINHIDIIGCSALFYAAEYGNKQLVERILSHPDTNVGISNYYGWTPLHGAALRGHKDICAILIVRRDVFLHSKTDRGDTAFDLAKSRGHDEVAEMLERAMQKYPE